MSRAQLARNVDDVDDVDDVDAGGDGEGDACCGGSVAEAGSANAC